MNMFDLYTDYLISSFSQTTSTGLSALFDGAISHDKITRFLSSTDFTSKDLWLKIKHFVHEISSSDGVLIFDDTIQEKAHTDENEIFCWHYDHCSGRSVKGVNILNCVYFSQGVTLPISFEIIKKYPVSDLKSHVETRRASKSKNEILREMLAIAVHNNVIFQYVLADSWYSSADNMKYIVKTLKKDFVMPVKNNRLVALTEEAWKKKDFVSIEELPWDGEPMKIWLNGVTFPLIVHKQIFINKDKSVGILYLTCSNLKCTKDEIEEIYQKRWNIECFHKTLGYVPFSCGIFFSVLTLMQ